MDVSLQITTKGMKNGCDGGKKSLLFAKGDKRFSAGGKNGIEPLFFLKKECSELRRNSECDMEIRAVWEKLIHISDPLVDLNFGTD